MSAHDLMLVLLILGSSAGGALLLVLAPIALVVHLAWGREVPAPRA
jgi:hypothetical protein